MTQQTILWTVVPHGRVEEGQFEGHLRVSIIASPRLTPQAADEQVLKAFPEWVNWPNTLTKVKFILRIGQEAVELRPVSESDPDLWAKLFSKKTPVSGYVFKDMSKVNLRSFSIRNVLGTVRKHYKALAIQSTGTPPTLLPWADAHPDLKGMLGDLGTRTEKIKFADRAIEVLLPGFNRFFDDDNRRGVEHSLRESVFGSKSTYRAEAVATDVDEQGNPMHGAQFPV
ncbi:hypothetical protein, partial [Phyllobacterium sp. P5_D12]